MVRLLGRVTRHFHEKAGTVNIFWSTPDEPESEGCSRRSRSSQVEICRNGAEQARTRVSAAKRTLACEQRSGVPTTVDGRRSGNSFSLVSSELLKSIHKPLSLNSASADSPYFRPDSWWSYRSGASWVSSIGNGCCRLGAELNVSVSSDVVPGACRSHPNSAICSKPCQAATFFCSCPTL